MAEKVKVGYARVSTKEQNLARQLEAFEKIGIDERNVFFDKESGKDMDRDGFKAMLRYIRKGDEVYFVSLDRMGRNYDEMAEAWRVITEEIGADAIVMDMPILDTRENRDLTGRLISDIVFKLLSYVAQNEREKIRARQAEGIAIAKAQGKYKGRKPIEIDKAKFEEMYGKAVRKECTHKYAMKVLGLKPNTYYRAVADFKNRTGIWGNADDAKSI